MTQVEKVAELFTTATGTEAFLRWAADDVTQRMLGAARELARPCVPSSADAGAIGLALGKVLGATEVVEYLASPFRASREPEIVPSYGATEILQENGYGNAED